MNEEIEFKGWAVGLDDLQMMVDMARKAGKDSLRFGVAGMTEGSQSEFIDPQAPGEYSYERFKLFIRGVAYAYATNAILLTTTLNPNATFDEFPPIPPEPIQDPGGG